MPALAQDAGAATSNTPATDSIGPRELQNFSIDGTVTRQADPQPAERPPAKPATATSTQTNRAAVTPARRAAEPASEAAATPQPRQREAAQQAPESPRQAPPGQSVTVALPKLQDDLPRGGTAATVRASSSGFDEPETQATLAPERKISFLPWLLAAMALGAGGAFLFYRRRHGGEALAGGPQIDAFVAPEPLPPAAAPESAPVPPRHPPASIPGFVSTRLRPWIDFGFEPLRCIVDDKQVTVEFELEILNSGNAPARAVLVEATLFNAGPHQDSEIGAFFANPVGEGDRIAMIQPLKRTVLRPKVTIPHEQVQVYEVGGRKVFVPLIAFNALYSWGSGEGQSSISYLIGRDTNGEKMAPIRLDLGPRLFRGLGSRPLPTGVRR